MHVYGVYGLPFSAVDYVYVQTLVFLFVLQVLTPLRHRGTDVHCAVPQ